MAIPSSNVGSLHVVGGSRLITLASDATKDPTAVPTFRTDLESIPRYVPGRPIEEVARELGISSIDKLASNESPVEPFPEVVEAVARAANGLNRYPDSACHDLTRAIAEHHAVTPESVWVGAGSSEILRCTALSVGGPGTSAVFAEPSFVMYMISTLVAGSEPVTVPLTASWDHDLDRMLAAIREDTTLVYVCNPNNPTGGIRSGDDIRAFIAAVPDTVTVIVDEAYAEYVTDPSYASMLEVAVATGNVMVARTFSKIYGLAGLRVGYGVASPDLIERLRITQAPFTVNGPAQVAAIEALRHQDTVAERSVVNAIGREALARGLEQRGFEVLPSQANFVYFEPDGDARSLGDALLREGEIVRVLGNGIRVTVGTDGEIARFLAAIDVVGVRGA
jgi:histidinol-phosphate aminotransferase